MFSAATGTLGARPTTGPSEPRPTARHDGDRDLPHRCARRPCRALRGLRPHAHRLQLVPESALPEVPVGCRRKTGWRRARPSCCRCRTSTSCSLCPAQIGAIAYQNKAKVYGLLFKAAAETLTTIAADPKHLGAEIGLTAVLHTWGQNLDHHPHVHCIVPGGGISPDGKRWVVAVSASSCRCGCSRACSGACSSKVCQALHVAGELQFFTDLVAT